jgi:hypothetical protein
MKNNLLATGLAISIAIVPNLFAAQSSQAITWEEAEKIFGVLKRYSEDIQKTFAPSQSTNQPATPVEAPTSPTNTDELDRQESEVAQ